MGTLEKETRQPRRCKGQVYAMKSGGVGGPGPSGFPKSPCCPCADLGAVYPTTPLLGAPSLCPGRSARPASVGFHKTLKSKSRAYPQVLFPFNLGFIIYVCLFHGNECFRGTCSLQAWSDLFPLNVPRRMWLLITIMPPILQHSLLFGAF